MTLPAIVRLRNYRDYIVPDGQVMYLDYTAPPGKVYVAVVLGTELKDGTDPLPIIEFLRNLEIDGTAVVPEPAEAQP